MSQYRLMIENDYLFVETVNVGLVTVKQTNDRPTLMSEGEAL